MARTQKPKADAGKPASSIGNLQLERVPGKTDEEIVTGPLVHPHARNAQIVGMYGGRMFPDGPPNITVLMKLVIEACEKVRGGDLSGPTDTLTAQMMSLDAVYTEMMRVAIMNLQEYPDAFERYMRLALKAQGQARATAEAIGKIARGGEQVVRHIHVDNRGGQAVIAETVHTGGANAGTDGQPQAPGAASAGFSALPGQNPFGYGVPIPGDAERPMPNARGEVAGGAARKP